MKSRIFFIVAAFVFVYGCKKLDYGSPALKVATLTLAPLSNISLNGTTAVCNTALNASDKNYTYGFCYALTRNPVIPGVAAASQNYSAGSFSALISNLQYGKKYYIRAFVTNGLLVNYSNQDSFTVPNYIATDVVKNITSRTFDVAITLQPTPYDSITKKGICYSTKTKPTIDSMTRFSTNTDTGTVVFNVTDTLKAGTTYYLRSFVIAGSQAYYGNEVSFTTAGYKGGSGGYVFFDKGDTTNGWRYLEAALDTITIANAVWGCSGTSVPGTVLTAGSGLENSNAIIANCADTNAAAAICRSLVLKNKTDWYLPSADELKALYNLKISKVFANHAIPLFSSTQASAVNCYAVDFSSGLQTTLPKNSTAAFIWPVRRF